MTTNSLPIRIDEIADLATEVACQGAIAVMTVLNDQIFEQTVSIAALIYEMYPG